MDRKRLARWAAGLLLVVGLFFVGRTCQAENADVSFVFERGDGPAIEHFDVALVRGAEVVGSFERRPSPGATGELARWQLDLDPGVYQLELELTSGGARRRVVRRVEAVARGTIRLDLSRL